MLEAACYAASPAASRGRLHREDAPGRRNQFQRDRDRIIHSSAFRRLEYKTQVFVNHEGDMFRTRLTHSIEVAQIGRTIARALRLDEDLTEAICLAHDLGHTPFGHAGQDALNECMRDYGGFEHNFQSLRVVDLLEEKYAEFPGLNLTYETREGILKHCSRRNARLIGELGQRFLSGTQPSLEAQIANLADEIAYNNHDVDDGLRERMLSMEQLADCELIARHYGLVNKKWPRLPQRRLRHEIIRGMINTLVEDVVIHSQTAIDRIAPAGIDDIRALSEALIALSPEILPQHRQLKKFLMENLYRHERVLATAQRAAETVKALFQAYMNDHALLPDKFRARLRREPEAAEKPRVIADYIAGMTDRYALAEQERVQGAV